MQGLRRISNKSRAALAGAASVLVIAGAAGGAVAASDDQETAQPAATTTQIADEDTRRGPGGPPPGAEAVQELLGLDQEQIREARESGSSLAEIAEEQGVSLDELTSAIVAAADERLDEAVSEGRISQDEADTRLAEIQENVTERVQSTETGPGPRHGGPPPGAEAVQELLGLDREQIREARESGSSLAEIAEQQGVSLDELTSAIVAAADERLDEAVSEGRISQDEADTRLAEIQENVTEPVQSTETGPGPRHGGPPPATEDAQP